MPDELKDLDNLGPIDHAVVAKAHTPVYKMHRYFARRPWSVFRSLVEHYSNPGSIILDPFCGGGVTVVEGLRLGRKVIGVDINPLATFITRMEVVDVDLDELKAAFERVEAACRERIEELYLTTCPKCKQRVPADWYEWTKVLKTPESQTVVLLSKCQKLRGGFYEFRTKGRVERFKPLDCQSLDDIMIAVHVNCQRCKVKSSFEPSADDTKRMQHLWSQYESAIESERLPIPTEMIPDGNMVRENALFKRGITHFRHFFTPRNLIANGILKRAILSLRADETVQSLVALAFGSSLKHTNNLVQAVPGFAGGRPEWSRHAFWPPDVYGEMNVAFRFHSAVRALLRGKKESVNELRPTPFPAQCFTEVSEDSGGRNFLVITGSSDQIAAPDCSVDVVITDPPYGGNVQYTEMSNFWTVWLKEWCRCGLIDGAKEAITTRHQNFEGAKDIQHYRNMLHAVFKECHRVLKPRRWMVMTFHCREFKVWSALHMAAHDAGFVMAERDGMIHQPQIKQYDYISHTKESGSMLGDFILSFQKVDKPQSFSSIEHAEIGRNIERLAGEAIIYHNGAPLSTIYMKLIPWLLNNNLLGKIGEKEVVPYLSRNFNERDGKWYVKDNPDEALKEDLEQYSQQHYKSSYSDATRAVPIEARLEYLIRRLLYKKGQATQDEVLNEIYTNLINSNAADYGEIQLVLSRVAQLRDSTEGLTAAVKKGVKKRKVWRLKEDIEREELWAALGADVKIVLETTEESDHDLAIARLVEIAAGRSLRAHIGKTEQMKYAEFRKMCSELPQRVQGMSKAARDIIEQIDVLWHNGGKGLVAAFEVERTTTITSGIDRFRNLLTAAPGPGIELYLVVPKARGNEVRNKLGSPANRKDGLHKKIGYIYLEDLDIRRAGATVDFEKITHFINGGQ